MKNYDQSPMAKYITQHELRQLAAKYEGWDAGMVAVVAALTKGAWEKVLKNKGRTLFDLTDRVLNMLESGALEIHEDAEGAMSLRPPKAILDELRPLLEKQADAPREEGS